MAAKYCKHCEAEIDLTDLNHWYIPSNGTPLCKITQKKRMRDRQDKKMMAKYGVARPRGSKEYYQSLTKKKEETCLQKYGVKNPMHVAEFLENQKKTAWERYGYQSHTQHPDVIAKTKKTKAERRGNTGYFPKRKSFTLSNGTPLAEFLQKYQLPSGQFTAMFRQKPEAEFLTTCQEYLQSDALSVLLNYIPADVSAIINRSVPGLPLANAILRYNGLEMFIYINDYYWVSERLCTQADLKQMYATARETPGRDMLHLTRAQILLQSDAVYGMLCSYFKLDQSIKYSGVKKLSKKDSFSFFRQNSLSQLNSYTDAYALVDESGQPIVAISIKAVDEQTIQITRVANRAGATVDYTGFSILLSEIAMYHPSTTNVVYWSDARFPWVSAHMTELFQRGVTKYSYEWTDGYQLYPKNRFSKKDNTSGMLRVFNAGVTKNTKVL